MGHHRRSRNSDPLSLRFVADWEERIRKQRQLIRELKRKGHSTQSAEATLKQQEKTLYTLHNHSQIMRQLLESDAENSNLQHPS
jgi:hypothetical protein